MLFNFDLIQYINEFIVKNEIVKISHRETPTGKELVQKSVAIRIMYFRMLYVTLSFISVNLVTFIQI